MERFIGQFVPAVLLKVALCIPAISQQRVVTADSVHPVRFTSESTLTIRSSPIGHQHQESLEKLSHGVKSEFLHAWNAYKQYAWGHDALKPLSKQPHDLWGTSLC